MTTDKSCHVNLLGMHAFYTEGNMESIAKMMPIDISITPGIVENIFVGADCSLEDI
jgi:hypothetical protein